MLKFCCRSAEVEEGDCVEITLLLGPPIEDCVLDGGLFGVVSIDIELAVPVRAPLASADDAAAALGGGGRFFVPLGASSGADGAGSGLFRFARAGTGLDVSEPPAGSSLVSSTSPSSLSSSSSSFP